MTVLAASGDAGAADYDVSGENLLPFRQGSWPASDPLVTSVGGTQIFLDANGNRVKPDEVWNESAIFDDSVAGGGDRSAVFARPCVPERRRERRRTAAAATRTSSMNAAVYESPILYWTIPGDVSGYILGVGGTSAATPLFAGFVAVADQVAGCDLGLLNPALYSLHGSSRVWST